MLPKLLGALASPLDVVLALALAALVLSRRGRPRAAFAAGAASLAILWAASTPAVAGALLARLERETPPVAPERAPRADAIVVLGGALAGKAPPRLSAELTDASDRLVHAARLYRAGRAPLVVASGGGAPVPESAEMAQVLVELGVPASAIVEESRSTSTRENALETRRLLAARGVDHVLLVTSALHMPRARRAFARAGLRVIPAPSDFRVVDRVPGGRGPAGWLPNAGGLNATSDAVHELVGLAYYGLRRWI